MNSESLSYFVARGETRSLTDSMRLGLRGSFIHLSDGVTHYELEGRSGGELVLLMPTLMAPLFYWDQFARWLHAMGLRTLTYSAYGSGYSDRVSGQYGPALFVRQAQELLSKLGLHEVHHVIGASMGAVVAMEFLQKMRCCTRTLTLVGPIGMTSRFPFLAYVARNKVLAQILGPGLGWAATGCQVKKSVRTSENATLLKQMMDESSCYEGSTYALLSTLRAFSSINQQALYLQASRLSIPILLLWGEEDRMAPARGVDEAKSLLQPTDVRLIPECGHMAAFERSDLVARVFSFFRKSTQLSFG
jgi:pimeloyl-ACP methyl ester carboxylesterase